MEFLETPVFTRQVSEWLTDEDYALMQTVLSQDPMKGDLIQGSGGLRKLRWRISGQGKRGGLRVIYYWMGFDKNCLYMLLIYKKNQFENLTTKQVRMLKEIVEEET